MHCICKFSVLYKDSVENYLIDTFMEILRPIQTFCGKLFDSSVYVDSSSRTNSLENYLLSLFSPLQLLRRVSKVRCLLCSFPPSLPCAFPHSKLVSSKQNRLTYFFFFFRHDFCPRFRTRVTERQLHILFSYFS